MDEIVSRQFMRQPRMIGRKVSVSGRVRQEFQPRGAEHRFEAAKPDARAKRLIRIVAGEIDGEIEGKLLPRLSGGGGEPLPPFDVPSRLCRTRQIDERGKAQEAIVEDAGSQADRTSKLDRLSRPRSAEPIPGSTSLRF